VASGIASAMLGCNPAVADDGPDLAAIDRYVRSEMDAQRIPGLALGIVHGDRIMHVQGFEQAEKSGRDVTPQTPFLIGSVTKSFTALASCSQRGRPVLLLLGVHERTILSMLGWSTTVMGSRYAHVIAQLIAMSPAVSTARSGPAQLLRGDRRPWHRGCVAVTVAVTTSALSERSVPSDHVLLADGIIDLMDVRVLYLEGCASWHTATERLRQALVLLRSPDTPIKAVQVGFEADGDNAVFGGSPTILVDGQDLFPTSTIPAGAVCRLYSTPAGMAGSPTDEAIVSALTRRSKS
jgi:hypothetical protein